MANENASRMGNGEWGGGKEQPALRAGPMGQQDAEALRAGGSVRGDQEAVRRIRVVADEDPIEAAGLVRPREVTDESAIEDGRARRPSPRRNANNRAARTGGAWQKSRLAPSPKAEREP